MQYIQSEDDRYAIQVGFTARYWEDPEVLRDKLVKNYKRFEELTNTNRSMWPETELVGAKLENEEKYLKLKVKSDEIEIRVENIDKIEDAYKVLEERLTNVNLDVPSAGEFKLDGMTFFCENDDIGVSYDESKCVDRDYTGCKFVSDDVEFRYSSVQGMVSFIVDNGSVPMLSAGQIASEIIDSEILVIGDIDELDYEE